MTGTEVILEGEALLETGRIEEDLLAEESITQEVEEEATLEIRVS